MEQPNRKVFVVVPAYNEGRVLARTLAPLIDAQYSVVVVDDGSKDDTWECIKTLPVYGLRHPINLGQGAALQTGMTFACNQHAEYIVHFDADGQHQVANIEGLLRPLRLGKADVALGSRFLRPADCQAVPWKRRILLRGARFVNFVLTGVWLTDTHNGFRALTGRGARLIQLYEDGFGHASEILIRIREQRLRYVEMPTHVVYTDYSQAKGQSAWNALNIVFDVLLRRML